MTVEELLKKVEDRLLETKDSTTSIVGAACWFQCCWLAEGYRDFSHKDLAREIQTGIKGTEDLEELIEWVEWLNEAEDNWEWLDEALDDHFGIRRTE